MERSPTKSNRGNGNRVSRAHPAGVRRARWLLLLLRPRMSRHLSPRYGGRLSLENLALLVVVGAAPPRLSRDVADVEHVDARRFRAALERCVQLLADMIEGEMQETSITRIGRSNSMEVQPIVRGHADPNSGDVCRIETPRVRGIEDEVSRGVRSCSEGDHTAAGISP